MVSLCKGCKVSKGNEESENQWRNCSFALTGRFCRSVLQLKYCNFNKMKQKANCIPFVGQVSKTVKMKEFALNISTLTYRNWSYWLTEYSVLNGIGIKIQKVKLSTCLLTRLRHSWMFNPESYYASSNIAFILDNILDNKVALMTEYQIEFSGT